MKTNALKDYLSVVANIEKERYMQDNLYSYLQQRISQLGIPAHIEKPIRSGAFDATDLLMWIGGGALFGFIGGGIICGIISLFNVGLFDTLIHLGGLFHTIFIGGLVTAAIAMIGVIIYAVYAAKSDSLDYNYRYKKYVQACSNDKARVENELKERELFVQQQNLLAKQMQETKEILQALYNKGIIYKKYHWNFVAICTFYEYIDSQRFTELGAAYNQYEVELRLEHITDRLDIIIDKLDELIRIQYIICSKISEANHMLNKIWSSNLEIASHIQEIDANGDELNSRISTLQRNSDFMLYLTEEHIKEQDYRKRYSIN